MIYPQKMPSSTSKINAESRYVNKMLNEVNYIEKAKNIAKAAHLYQKRKNGSDYFDAHIQKVVDLVYERRSKLTVEWGSTYMLPLVVSAAYLHDTVEDTSVTLEYIRREFPEVVHQMVDALTRRKNETYFDFIMRIKKSCYGAKYIKICDIIQNMSDFTENDKMGSLYSKYELSKYILEGVD